MPKERIVRVPFLIPNWAAAQVPFPGVILVKQGVELTPRLIAHELKHSDQARRLGVLRYWARYFRLRATNSYLAHPMETEARIAESNETYLARARRLIAEA